MPIKRLSDLLKKETVDDDRSIVSTDQTYLMRYFREEDDDDDGEAISNRYSLMTGETQG